MNDVVIQVSNIGKRYKLGAREGYGTIRETLALAVSKSVDSILRRKVSHEPKDANEIWALRNVDFEISRGEIVGVIGRNGAGKSTLLKVLSRITAPEEGYAEIRGRIGSLLEVGTGFHHELSGRENIFLNGAILGMRRREIEQKFDEIVAFAEVEKFIDTPVKHYSSGMYLRLAFAVAANLNPEILLVDEVLAVGDASFQRRCLNKMDEVSREGRTVFFVSHNMAAITSLTERCLLLHGGHLVMDGPTSEVVSRYLEDSAASDFGGIVDLKARIRRSAGAALDIQFCELILTDRNGRNSGQFYENEAIDITLVFEVRRAIREFDISLSVSARGIRLFSVTTGKRDLEISEGKYRVKTKFDPNVLRPGVYNISLGIQSSAWQDGGYDLAAFEIVENPEEKEKKYPTNGDFGVLYFPYVWNEPQRIVSTST